jgi:hypothetical protein
MREILLSKLEGK